MKKSCIIIDDDTSFLTVMKTYLKQIEWLELIDSFDNPVRGATAIIQQKPDVILTDYQMPYVNGTDLLEWLGPQLNLMSPKPQIIVISGNQKSEVNNLKFADGFICKKDIVDQDILEMHLKLILKP
jgi:two-component SAPR family response regulator